jgi:hypothetical protein
MTVYTSRFGFQWNYAPHAVGWGDAFNTGFRTISALLHPTLISDIEASAPSASEGDAYFIPTPAAGEWGFYQGQIAVYQGGVWHYYPPTVGMRAYFVNHEDFYWWTGAGWALESNLSDSANGVLTVAGHLPDSAGNVNLVYGDIAGAAPLSSPSFLGIPLGPTAASHNNSTQLATTAYVDGALNALGGVVTLTQGTGIIITGSGGAYTISANTTVLATQAYVTGLGYAPLASPTFTGTVTIPAGAVISGYAPLASPTFTGTPAAPTPSTADNSTKLATTAFVKAQGYGVATGTVTSVAMTVPADLSVAGSPITTNGTLAITRNNQNANLVLAGPASGAAAAPTYRVLTAADLPAQSLQPYIIAGFFAGVPTASQVMLIHRCGTAITFASNFGTTASGADTGGGCLTNATASTVISVDRCLAASDPTSGGSWTQIGTLTIGAGGHTMTAATVGGTSKTAAKGDFIRTVGPVTPDTTAANIFTTLAGDR